MIQEYNEDRELTRYLWDNYPAFLTEFERRVGRAIIARGKAEAAKSPFLEKQLLRKGMVGIPEIDSALAEGHEAYRRRVRDQLLSEHVTEIFINRCTRCGCVVRTPLARQCLWCGYDWHNASY